MAQYDSARTFKTPGLIKNIRVDAKRPQPVDKASGDGAEGALKYPVIAVNDAETKMMFDKPLRDRAEHHTRYNERHEHPFCRKTIVVAGYGLVRTQVWRQGRGGWEGETLSLSRSSEKSPWSCHGRVQGHAHEGSGKSRRPVHYGNRWHSVIRQRAFPGHEDQAIVAIQVTSMWKLTYPHLRKHQRSQPDKNDVQEYVDEGHRRNILPLRKEAPWTAQRRSGSRPRSWIWALRTGACGKVTSPKKGSRWETGLQGFRSRSTAACETQLEAWVSR